MGALSAFLYGWVAGIIGVVLCILYGFDTLLFIMRLPNRVLAKLPFGAEAGGKHTLLADVADAAERSGKARQTTAHAGKESLREQGLEGIVAGSKTASVPLKLTAVCSVSWYEEGMAGPPLRCRLVLAGRVLTVYELLPTAGMGIAGGSGSGSGGGSGRGKDGKDKGGEQVRKDGRERTGSSAEHLRGRTDVGRLDVQLKKGVRKDKNRPSNIFTGKMLILRTTDGEPVVNARDADQGIFASTSDTIAAGAGAGGSLGWQSPTDPHFDGTVSVSGASIGVDPLSFSPARPETPPVGATSGARRGVSTWLVVVLKFRDYRETERWSNILRGLQEAEAWRDFSKTLPNPDTTNLLLSRFFFQNMRGEGLASAIKKQIQKKLKKISLTKFPRDMGGEILLDDFVIGKQIPWVSDVSEPTVSTNGEFGFDFNLHYKGGDEGFTLFFRLALTYRDVRVPHVVFSVKLHELEATVHVSIGPPPSKKFWIAGHKPPVAKLEVHQGCASGKGLLHRILTALPDLSGMITNLIKMYLVSGMVLPYMDDFPLPSFDNTPKSSRTASPKTRVFDRKRAAQKSAAPDMGFAVPSTSVRTGSQHPTAILTPSVTPPNASLSQQPPLTLSMDGSFCSPPPPAVGTSGLSPSPTPLTAVPKLPEDCPLPPTVAAHMSSHNRSPATGFSTSELTPLPGSPSVRSESLQQRQELRAKQTVALPVFGSTGRSGASSSSLGLRSTNALLHDARGPPPPPPLGASAGAATHTSAIHDAVAPVSSASFGRASGAAGGGGGGSWTGLEWTGGGETFVEDATVLSEGQDGTRRTRRAKLADLKTALKMKGGEMDRGAVSKAKAKAR